MQEGNTRSDSFDHIINMRTNPAVLIFDREDRLLYFNKESQSFLRMFSENLKMEGTAGPVVPEEITSLCNRLKGPGKSGTENHILTIDQKDSGRLYVAQAHFIHPAGDLPDHIIVIIQPVVASHIDSKKISDDYGLSKRELEVLKLICDGCSNREISERLYISEFTTRDHLKRIMRKMGVSSRNKIIALAI